MGTRASSRALDDVNETIEVPHRLSSASAARHALVESMAGQRVAPGVVREAEVVVSELVTNCVQHADALPGDEIKVAWSLRKGVIEVAVTDAGSDTVPVPARRHVLADSGRGLRIVRSFAHEWGVLEAGRTVTVWASLGGPSRRRTR